MRVILLLIICSLFSSCGGGGGGGGGGGSGSSGAGGESTSPLVLSEYDAQYGLEKINADDAYSYLESQGKPVAGDGVIIAISDGGIQSSHPDISANFSSDSYNPNFSGLHGTHVASIAAGVKNGSGIHGVAYNATILGVKTFGFGGNSDTPLKYSVDHGAKVANLSWQVTDINGDTIFLDVGSSQYNSEKATFQTEIDDAVSGDLFVAIAAGNDSNTSYVSIPAVFVQDEDLNGQGIAVAAVDENNNITDFSNHCSQVKDFCLVAPGDNIYAAIPINSYTEASGTSMAAPQVAGAAAVIRAAWPGLSANQVTQILLLTALDLGAPGVDDVYGHGLLDLDNAVRAYGEGIISPSSTNYSGSGYSIEASSISPSMVFGDAYLQNVAPILQDAIFLDYFGRDYKANLDQKIAVSSDNSYSLSNLMFNSYETAELPVNSGFADLKFKFRSNNLQRDPLSGELRPNKLGLKYLFYDKSSEDLNQINQNDISFSYSQKIGKNSKFSFSNNDFGNNLNQEMFKDFGFIAASYNFSPYLNLASQNFSSDSNSRLNQKKFLISHKLNKNWETSFYYFNSSSSNSFLKSGDTQNNGFDGSLNYSLNDSLKLNFDYGSLREYNSRFLGSKSSGAFSNEGSTVTNHFKVTATKKLLDNLYLISSYSEGKTNINGNNIGIFRNFDDVRSRGFSLGFLNKDILGGNLGIMYSEPLRVYKGSVDIDIPVSLNSDGTINRLRANGVSLKPTGKQRDLELFYGSNLSDYSHIRLNLLIQSQPGNIKSASTSYLYMLGYDLNF